MTTARTSHCRELAALRREMEQMMEVIERLNRRVQATEDTLAMEMRINAMMRGRLNSVEGMVA